MNILKQPKHVLETKNRILFNLYYTEIWSRLLL